MGDMFFDGLRNVQELLGVQEKVMEKELEIAVRRIMDQIRKHMAKEQWKGEFLAQLKAYKVGTHEWEISSTVFYAELVESGHKSVRFWPFSTAGGALTRLGEWAIEKQGLVNTGQLNYKGYAILSDGVKTFTGMTFRAPGKRVFGQTAFDMENQIPPDFTMTVWSGEEVITFGPS